MSDTLITVIAIALAAVLMFIFPLMTVADRTDDVSQLAVKSAVTDLVDKVRTTGKLTETDYSQFIQTITATGNTYDIEMEAQIKDTNLKKHGVLTSDDKIGESSYYTTYTSQILTELDSNEEYKFKEGDIFLVRARSTNLTISQQLQNFFYRVTGNNTYAVAAEHSGIVTASGK